jgi:choline dehydrogenase-like flavoprotein
MGKPDSPESVVDTTLKVIGTEGLRVLDLSIVPVIITTNTQAPALMIGEKGSDIIMRHWKGDKFSRRITARDSPLSNSINSL